MSSPCWSPTAADFSRHQLAHVTNFWRQGRAAEYRLKALPSGRAELCLTFELPSPSESIPPPMNPAQGAPPRNVTKSFFPQGPGSGSGTKQKPASPKVSSRQRKSYRRSVLHRAALAAPCLPPPQSGSLRQAALACVKRLQVDPALQMDTESAKKRSAALLSPSNLSPLAQRIRSDIGIAECEVESPERELLRSQLCPENTPPPCSPCVKGFPSPAPLVFTPCKIQEVAEISGSNVKVPPLTVFKCLNCDGPMGASHQCGDFSSPKETVMQNTSRIIRNLKKFCSVCETFHKADTKCRSCATPEPPPKTVKCHVCACLGRETSLVQCGSVCPSCGVTAIAS